MPLFVDTNLLVYAQDSADQIKQKRAQRWLEALWRSREGRVSTQVLQEYYVTITQKLDPAVPTEVGRKHVRSLAQWKPVTLDAGVIESAWRVQDSYSIPFWDALIVGAATRAACTAVLTEDLQHGATIEGVDIIDPFQVDPGDIIPES